MIVSERHSFQRLNLALLGAIGIGGMLMQFSTSASAGTSWYSKARVLNEDKLYSKQAFDEEKVYAKQSLDGVNTTIFDIVVSLYNKPTGNNDANHQVLAEEQTAYEEIIRHFADSVCEQSNAALKLGKVRLFNNGAFGESADIVWEKEGWPQAHISGFGAVGQNIFFGDIMPDGCPSCIEKDINFLDASNHQNAGYTLGHEFGHYVLGLYDEYEGKNPATTRISSPQVGDIAVDRSIMHSQWKATSTGDLSWLNHSTQDNFSQNTAQGRVYGASGWDVLVQSTADDPKNGARSNLAQRVRYNALSGAEPRAADNWIQIELPAAQQSCRSELDIIWMQDDIEVQLVIDRSNSMSGQPMDNAKQAANILVDELVEGKSALGVVTFNTSIDQVQPITPIIAGVKNDIKSVINNIFASNLTAMFDAAELALDNLSEYSLNNNTLANQLVFLLSDGKDNASSETQESLTRKYLQADVPLNTFAYGSFAPDGVLRQLAKDTGGIFRMTPTNVADLSRAFLSAIAAQTKSVAVKQSSTVVESNEFASTNFVIDSSLERVYLFVNYQANINDLDLELVSSMGNKIELSDFLCDLTAQSTACRLELDIEEINKLGMGNWKLNTQNLSVSPVKINIDIIANPKPRRTYDIALSVSEGKDVVYPAPMVITAAVSKGLRITNIDTFAKLIYPDGTESVIDLHDDGLSGDVDAGDGIYSAIIDASMNGIHAVELTVSNEQLDAEFTLEGYQPTHFHSSVARTIGQNGNSPSTLNLPVINENFTRTTSVQFNVANVVEDDYTDQTPGTVVTPNNHDVYGKIEKSGDVDIFTVPTNKMDTIVFRVTDISTGMQPYIRVFAEDGKTEISASSLSGLDSHSEYLVVEVEATGYSELHAEVSHAQNGTGSYQFSAGKRIVSDPINSQLPIGLKNGKAVSNIALNEGDYQKFYMDVPIGAKDVRFVIQGNHGDADLYVKYQTEVTTSDYDCRPYLSGSLETCSTSNLIQGHGRYYVLVSAFSDFTDLSLIGSYKPAVEKENTPIWAINVGGDAYTSVNGIHYITDSFKVGRHALHNVKIAGTQDDTLYKTEAWNSDHLTYELPVVSGNYRVRLHFAEVYSDITGPDQRVFDIELEGNLTLRNFDIYKTIGFARAYYQDFEVDVYDNNLTIRLKGNIENPKLSAIEVWSEKNRVKPPLPVNDMQYIEGGSFFMGCFLDDSYCRNQELPLHRVELDPFYMSKTEITYYQYAYYCDQVASCTSHTLNVKNLAEIHDLPVTYVSWHDVQAYIQWLNKQTGFHYRLPTEAEWEYAARAGTSTLFYWGNEPSSEHANGRNGSRFPSGQWPEDGYDQLSPVDSFISNPWGLSDMSGNVLEWCQDWYDEDYYLLSPSNNPQGSATGSEKVLRGGAWYSNPQIMRHAYRFSISADYKNDGIGFRLVREY